MNARDIIRAEYSDSRNFITPDRIKVGSIARGRVAYELSTGSGIKRGTVLYGVTVVGVNRHGDTLRLRNLSRCFTVTLNLRSLYGLSGNPALEYIEELKGRF